jgi:predicted transcriptional regulator
MPRTKAAALTKPLDQHITPEQIAKEWGITRRTVRRALDAAGVPYLQHASRQRRYYERSAIEAYVTRKTVTPGTAN